MLRKRRFAKLISCLVLQCALIAHFGSTALAQNVTAPITRIDSGILVGKTIASVDQYLGIPYAAPPTGDLRWRPPVAPAPWITPRVAKQHGSICPQLKSMGAFANAGGDEDCLFLNVFVAHNQSTAQEKRPVLVWIHGGGLLVGHSDGYDGSKLAMQGGAVVVTINYRLGVLGLMAHPALDSEGHKFANYGLLDQQFALQWVQRNIEQFGGDPDNVTIFGESSGGTSVMTHVVSPGATGLFQHAIAQSGSAIMLKYPAFGASRPLAAAQTLGQQFAVAAGCPDQSTACLRRLPLSAILSAQEPFALNQAIIDGIVLPTTYTAAFKSGNFNHVTLVNGNTRDEWRWLVGLNEIASGKPMTAVDYEAAILAYYGKDLAPRVLAHYPVDAYSTPSQAYGSAVTDSLFACTGHRLNKIVAHQIPTYAYEFADDTAPSYLEATSFHLGAAHTLELQYLFPGFHGGDGVVHDLNTFQRILSDRMVAYWSNASGAAAGKLWPRFSPADDNYLTLVAPNPYVRTNRFAIEHKCSFWDKSGLY